MSISWPHPSHNIIIVLPYLQFEKGMSKGMSKDTIYLMDPKNSLNTMNLSEDAVHQDVFEWGNEYVNPYTKSASHEATPMAAHHIHLGTSQ